VEWKYHDILKGLSPFVTRHVICTGSPAKTADSNSNGLIRGGTGNHENQLQLKVTYFQ